MPKKTYNHRFYKKKAKSVHGNTYDYSLVDYINSSTKVKIICPTHGVFEQAPNNHLNGNGCPKCALLNAGSKIKISFDKWVERSNLIHNNKYNYSLANLKTVRDKVKIKCRKHGIFKQEVGAHQRDCGCPKCNKFRLHLHFY